MNATETSAFLDRRNQGTDRLNDTVERRQFTESRDALSPDVRELAEAIDAFKLEHNRRYVTLAEVLEVAKRIGYHK